MASHGYYIIADMAIITIVPLCRVLW